jgi:hypothetical protein
MLKKLLIILVAVVMLGLSAPVMAEGFSTVIEDLPIMDGMTERADLVVVFDTPEGRIVETTLETAVGPEQVLTYYRRTLTQLGWKPVGTSEKLYIREKERMSIDVQKNPAAEAYGAANAYTVSFKISPRR